MSGKRSASARPAFRRAPPLILITACLAGCAVLSPLSPTPTSAPPPATIAPTETAVASPTPPPYTDATPPVVLDVPLPSPSPLPPTPSIGLPPERLSIYDPGPGSQALSPLLITGFGGPSWQGRVRLRLIGEEGDVLADRTTFLQAMPDLAGRIYSELEFSFGWVAQAARLEVRTFSPRDGVMDHLTTRSLVLLTRGTELLYPGLAGAEKIAIFSPRAGGLVRNGVITVRGGGWLDTPGPLVIEVLDRNGELVGSATTPLSTNRMGEVGSFEAQVSYSVPISQYGHVAVYERALDPPGILHYSSVEVYLQR